MRISDWSSDVCSSDLATIADVVSAFRHDLPEARIFVYDNGSSDTTAARARTAGAFILEEKKRGKGNVVRRMFADIDADVYVLSDGDLTYDISNVATLISELLRDRGSEEHTSELQSRMR